MAGYSYALGSYTACGTCGNDPWLAWNNQYTATMTATTANTVWISWNVEYQTYIQQGAQVQGNEMHIPTEAEMIAARNAAELQAKKRAMAKDNARKLLIENLSPAQRESYEKHGLFIVEGSKKNRYELHDAKQTRRLNKDGKAVTSYCIHAYGCPREDELLSFKLLLEANEDEFLKTANATAIAA